MFEPGVGENGGDSAGNEGAAESAALSFDELDSSASTPDVGGESGEAAKDEQESEAADSEASEAGEQLEGAEKKSDPALEKQKSSGKLYSTKVAGKELQVPAEAVFEVPVAGKAEQVPLQELINNYSGKTSWDKKFSALDLDRRSFGQEKQKFEAGKKQLTDQIQGFYKAAVEEGNPKKAVMAIAELMGVDPIKVYKDLTGQLQKAVEEMAGLTPEERKARELEEENAYLREREKEYSSKRDEAKTADEVKSRLSTTLEKHNLTEERFWQEYKALEKSESVKKADLTPEFVAEYAAEVIARETIRDQLGEIAPELKGDAKKFYAAIDDLRKVQEAQGLSSEELAEVARTVYGSQPEKNLTRKVERSKGATKPGAEKKAATAADAPLSFDEL